VGLQLPRALSYKLLHMCAEIDTGYSSISIILTSSMRICMTRHNLKRNWWRRGGAQAHSRVDEWVDGEHIEYRHRLLVLYGPIVGKLFIRRAYRGDGRESSDPGELQITKRCDEVVATGNIRLRECIPLALLRDTNDTHTMR